MDKVIGLKEAVSKIKDGDTIMFGGFLSNGSANKIIDYIADETDLKDLTLICNDTSFVDRGVGRLVVAGKIKTVIATHIGTNKETGRKMNEGEMEVKLVPQGTLAERVRAGGFGLGGVLTKTGVGIPEIEKGKQKIAVDGEDYLLETALRADVALVNARWVDKFGNMKYLGSTENFNNIMAFAADTVIVEADEIVEIGDIPPNEVATPGIVVDYIVDGGAL